MDYVDYINSKIKIEIMAKLLDQEISKLVNLLSEMLGIERTEVSGE